MNKEIETVRSIVGAAREHGIEMVALMALMETQNKGGVNQKLSDAGAARAAMVVRNAMLSRLSTMVCREFARPGDNDLHIGRAIKLLTGNTLVYFDHVGSADEIKLAIAQWKKLRGDHRHERIKDFRDKVAVHFGISRVVIPKPTYVELYAFCEETIDLVDHLVAGVGMTKVKIRANMDAQEQAIAFWRPWHAYAP
jgi:hypothetical protein